MPDIRHLSTHQPITRPSDATCQRLGQDVGADATAPSGSSRYIMRWPCSAAVDEPITRPSDATCQPTSQSHAPQTPPVGPLANNTPLRMSGAEATAPSGSSRYIMRWACRATVPRVSPLANHTPRRRHAHATYQPTSQSHPRQTPPVSA
jgi:hypothetical protein